MTGQIFSSELFHCYCWCGCHYSLSYSLRNWCINSTTLAKQAMAPSVGMLSDCTWHSTWTGRCVTAVWPIGMTPEFQHVHKLLETHLYDISAKFLTMVWNTLYEALYTVTDVLCRVTYTVNMSFWFCLPKNVYRVCIYNGLPLGAHKLVRTPQMARKVTRWYRRSGLGAKQFVQR